MTAMIQLIPNGHSRPIGQYSPGMATKFGPGDLLIHVSGQVATDANGIVLHPGDAAGQAVVVFERLRATLAAANATLADIISVTIFLSDRSYFQSVSAVRNQIFCNHVPASTLIIAQMMEEGCLLEINAVAIKSLPGSGGEI